MSRRHKLSKRAALTGAALAALLLVPPGRAATITVDTLSGAAGGDPTDCTLRDAITAANTDSAVDGCASGSGGSDVIVFAAALAGQTILFTEQDNFWYGPNALPPIYSEITIDGGTGGIVIERDAASPKMRFFYVAGMLHPVPTGPKTNPPSPGRLALRRLTLRGGLARGGHAGEGGGGAGLGGAVYNQGTLTFDQVLATGNVAEGGSSGAVGGWGGGGLGGDGGRGGGGGGFRENGDTDGQGEGGDFLVAEGGGSDLSGGGAGTSTIGGDGTASSAVVGGNGGGFQTMSDGGGRGGEHFFNNGCGGGGGFGGGGGAGVGGDCGPGGGGVGGGGGDGGEEGCGGGGGFGGGGGAGAGGGFGGCGGGGGFGGGGGRGGNGGRGGGGGAGGLGGTFGGAGGQSHREMSGGGGGAGLGGVIFNHFGIVTVTNSTLTANAAQGGAGGNETTEPGGGGGAGLGGAVFNLDGSVTIESSTLAANRATGGRGGGFFPSDGQGRGGAVFNHFEDVGVGNDLPVTVTRTATIVLEDSILAGSVDAPEDCFDNVTSAVTLQGVNLIETDAGGGKACGSALSGDPLLGPLQDNGGPTETLALLDGSPALDAAGACAPPSTDQRGAPRPIDFAGGGASCDLGAYERVVHRFIASGVTAVEGTGGATTFNFVVSRDVGFGVASIEVDTADGTAVAPVDYAPVVSLVLAFADGVTSQNVPVSIVTDGVVEPDETFTLLLSSPSADARIGVGVAAGTILDDDASLASSLAATKTVAGAFNVGGTVTYTIVVTNLGPADQADLPGDELVDVLPPEVALLGAVADAGVAVAVLPGNTVTWNGVLAAGESATITIVAEVLAAALGQTVANQATVSFDFDNDGAHDSSVPSDDPGEPGAEDPTFFSVAAVPIPTLGAWTMWALALALAGLAVAKLRASDFDPSRRDRDAASLNLHQQSLDTLRIEMEEGRALRGLRATPTRSLRSTR